MRKQWNIHDKRGSVKQRLGGAAVAALAMLGVAFTGSVLLFSIAAILLGAGRQFGLH